MGGSVTYARLEPAKWTIQDLAAQLQQQLPQHFEFYDLKYDIHCKIVGGDIPGKPHRSFRSALPGVQHRQARSANRNPRTVAYA